MFQLLVYLGLACFILFAGFYVSLFVRGHSYEDPLAYARALSFNDTLNRKLAGLPPQQIVWLKLYMNVILPVIAAKNAVALFWLVTSRTELTMHEVAFVISAVLTIANLLFFRFVDAVSLWTCMISNLMSAIVLFLPVSAMVFPVASPRLAALVSLAYLGNSIYVFRRRRLFLCKIKPISSVSSTVRSQSVQIQQQREKANAVQSEPAASPYADAQTPNVSVFPRPITAHLPPRTDNASRLDFMLDDADEPENDLCKTFTQDIYRIKLGGTLLKARQNRLAQCREGQDIVICSRHSYFYPHAMEARVILDDGKPESIGCLSESASIEIYEDFPSGGVYGQIASITGDGSPLFPYQCEIIYTISGQKPNAPETVRYAALQKTTAR